MSFAAISEWVGRRGANWVRWRYDCWGRRLSCLSSQLNVRQRR
ncbi:hypothetical protein CsSME_00031408 [Camellia sinensis var. sinensis]